METKDNSNSETQDEEPLVDQETIDKIDIEKLTKDGYQEIGNDLAFVTDDMLKEMEMNAAEEDKGLKVEETEGIPLEEQKLEEISEEEMPNDSIASFEGHGDFVYTLNFFKDRFDDNYILSGGGDDRIIMWDINNPGENLVEIKDFKDSIEYIELNHDGKYMLAGGMGNPVSIYQVKQPESDSPIKFSELFTLKRQIADSSDDLTFLKWHSKGNMIVAGSRDTLVWMWNAMNGDFTTFAGHSAAVTCGGFSNNGKVIISGSDDFTVKVWAPKTGECIRTINQDKTCKFHTAPITCLTMLKSNTGIVTGDREGKVFLS